MLPGAGGDCASQMANAVLAVVDNAELGCPFMFIAGLPGGSPPFRPQLSPATAVLDVIPVTFD